MQDRKRLEAIRAEADGALDRMEAQMDEMEAVTQALDRLAAVSAHADELVDQAGKEFSRATGLTGPDLCFLFAATALQLLRQQVLQRLTERVPHDESDRQAHELQDGLWNTDGMLKEGKIGKQLSTWYHASEEEILYTYSVPFDVTSGTKAFGVGGQANTGVSGNNHRYKTLGHDPLYGWVFGAGNIMTNTLTNYRLSSYHVRSGKIVAYGNTGKMLYHTARRSKHSPEVLAACLVKEGLHLSSDVFSYAGIPLPGIERWSGPEGAQMLAGYGLDCGLLVKTAAQSAAAELINLLIAIVHRLTLGHTQTDPKLLEVRTRKILLTSNCIATASSVIKTAVQTGAGVAARDPAAVADAVKSFDWGGALVTGHRLVKDLRFIHMVEEEFLDNRFYELVMQELDEGGAT